MLELLIFPTVAACAMAWKLRHKKEGKHEDRKTIQKVFENRKVGIVKGKGKDSYIQYPKFINSKEYDLYTSYIYKYPTGIALDEIGSLQMQIQDALNKEIKISSAGKQMMRLEVAKHPLPENFPLKSVLEITSKWRVVLGVSNFSIELHDFEKYPMVIGGGATRFGKTVLMKNVMTQLILQNPDDINIYIIDLKGGLEFMDYQHLKQVKQVATTPLEGLKLLGYLSEEKLNQRMSHFRENRYKNIVNTPIKQRDFIIVDECHDLFKTTDPNIDNKEKKKIENYMARIASMGGGLGFRLLAFTQYPVKEAMPQFVKQNAPVRIGFQVADSTASRVILDEGGLEDLPGIPGRAMVKSFKYTTIQVPYEEDHFQYVKHYEVKKDEGEHEGIQHQEERGNLVDFGKVGVR